MTALQDRRATAAEDARLTVLGTRRRLDLRLPYDVPIAQLLPELCDLLEPDGAPVRLARLTGAPLDGAATLAGSGVRDGDTLRVLALDASAGPPLLADLVEQVGTSRGLLWGTAARRWTLLSVLVLVVLSGGVLGGLAGPAGSRALALLALAGGALSATGAVLLTRVGSTRGAHALALSGLALWAAGGAHLPLAPASPLDRLCVAAIAALFGAALLLVALPALRPVVGAALLTALPGAAVLVIVDRTGASGRTLAGVLVLCWLVLLPYAPRLAATVAGLTTLARPGDEPAPDADIVATRIGRARQALVSTVAVAVAGVLIADAGLAATGPSPWVFVLLGLVPVALALRAPAHRQAAEVIVLALGCLGGVVVFAAAAILTWAGPAQKGAVAVAAALALAAALAGLVVADGRSAAVADRVGVQLALRRGEVLVRIATVVVAVGAAGGYTALLAAGAAVGGHL